MEKSARFGFGDKEATMVLKSEKLDSSAAIAMAFFLFEGTTLDGKVKTVNNGYTS